MNFGPILMGLVGYLCAALGLILAFSSAASLRRMPPGHHLELRHLQGFVVGASCAFGFTFGTLYTLGAL